jgi:putative hemolysin
MHLSNFLVEFVIILLLILINGVLALSEIAIVSARKARLQAQVDDGDVRAKAALALAENPTVFLSTVQVGITLVGILAGAIGGATIGTQLGAWISQIPVLAPYGSFLGFGIVVLVVTYLSLVFGELVPKRIALNQPERYARLAAPAMHILARATTPIVVLLSRSTEAALKLLRVKVTSEFDVTEDEIKILIDQGTQAGIIAIAEKDMLKSVFRLADRRVGSLLTPRTEITWLDLDDPPSERWQKVIESGHSLFPVARGSLDEVVGIVYAKELLNVSLQGKPIILEELIEEPIWVPESMLALGVLEIFEKKHKQEVLVIDEFGGFQGLVTINDILEAIVGETIAVAGFQEPEITRREDGSWLIDGMLAVDELKDLLGINQLPDEALLRYQTVGGLVMAYLGRIPVSGDQFRLLGYQFEVVDMDGMRVDKLLVQPIV